MPPLPRAGELLRTVAVTLSHRPAMSKDTETDSPKRKRRGTSVLSDASTPAVKLWAPYGLN